MSPGRLLLLAASTATARIALADEAEEARGQLRCSRENRSFRSTHPLNRVARNHVGGPSRLTGAATLTAATDGARVQHKHHDQHQREDDVLQHGESPKGLTARIDRE